MELRSIEALYPEHVTELRRGYDAALATSGFDAVILHSGTAARKTIYDDQYWPVRPAPHFQHWVALYEPGCFVIIESGKKPVLYWPVSKDFWEQPAEPESKAFMDVLDVRRTSEVAFPQGKRVAWIGEDLVRAKLAGFEGDSAVNPKALLDALDRVRTKKTPYEIACLVEANRRAALGHDAVKHAFMNGDVSELDLHLLYLKTTRQDDSETPYKNIVALGKNAAILHHIAYGRAETKAESILLDAGAMCLGYCSDITRTWVKTKGEAATSFAHLLTGMEAMQKRIAERAKDGLPYEDLHDESHRQVSAILKEAGLVKASADEIDGKGISRTFYPHGLGHSLGLQTHDVGCAVVKPKSENPFLRNTSTITKGQVFTIEPGLYFIHPLLDELRQKPEQKLVDWKMVEALAPLGGIRIEDDVLVTDAGVRNFTREVLPVGGGAV